ncbi:MAG: amino acid ABC transporter permease [Bacillota bacterium]
MGNLDTLLLYMLQGSGITLSLFAITLVLSLPLGFVASLGRLSKFKPLSGFIWCYTWIMRGTPLILQILFIYFGLDFLGIKITDRFLAAVIAFVLNYAAYFAEIFRGGIQSIGRGQYEASDMLGMTYGQTMMRIVLPQAFRRVLPPVSNEVITLVKDTALVYVIGLQDLLKVADSRAITTLNPTPYLFAAVFYLIITFIVTLILNALEKRFAYYEV